MTTFPLLLRLVLALCFVLGLIFGSLWLLRHHAPARFGRVPALPFPLQVVGRTSLAQRREVCAVRVADRLLLLGVTPMHVSLLSEIPNAFQVETAAEPRVNQRAATATATAAPPDRLGRSARVRPAVAPEAQGFGAELADLLGGLGRQQDRLRGEDV